MAFCDSEIISNSNPNVLMVKMDSEDKLFQSKNKTGKICLKMPKLKTIIEETDSKRNSKESYEPSISKLWQDIIKPKKNDYTHKEFIQDILSIIPKDLPPEITEKKVF